MNSIALLKESLRMLLLNKQRTILALFGILIGIGSVIAMVSIGEIIAEESMRQFRELGTDLILIDKEYAGNETSRKKNPLKLQYAWELTDKVHMVRASAPIALASQSAHFSGKTGGVNIVGSTSTLIEINKLRLKAGRFLVSMDERRQVVVIAEEGLNSLGWSAANADWVGKKLEIKGRVFEIVGVLDKASGTGGILNYDVNRAIIMPVTTAMRLYNQSELSAVVARVLGTMDIAQIVDQIKTHFAKVGNGLAVKVHTPQEIIDQMKTQGRMFTLLLGAVGSIAMVVGGVGIMNIMLVSVAERRREIGIRRALGARRSDIQKQFLVEAILLSLIGGVMGTVIGIGVSFMVSRSHDWAFQISMVAVWSGMAMAILVGVVFGYFPARQAAQVDPIKALQ
ncbi:MAG: ABC transporter permease [Magnetococcus sp. DMHC-1]